MKDWEGAIEPNKRQSGHFDSIRSSVDVLRSKMNEPKSEVTSCRRISPKSICLHLGHRSSRVARGTDSF